MGWGIGVAHSRIWWEDGQIRTVRTHQDFSRRIAYNVAEVLVVLAQGRYTLLGVVGIPGEYSICV